MQDAELIITVEPEPVSSGLGDDFIGPRDLIGPRITKNQRTYACDCGFSERRDVKGAKTTLSYGLYALCHSGKELTGLSAEELASVFSTYEFASLPGDAEDAPDFSPG